MDGDVIRLDDHWLHQWCTEDASQVTPSKAFEVAARLKNLAVWWLRPDVLKQAAVHAQQLGLKAATERWQQAPQLPTDPGACWVALVNKYPEQLGLLRPAYPLPLRWAKQPDHDPRLPAGLLGLADEVRRELERLGELSERWTLHPAYNALLSGLDLKTLEGRWDSGWASLAVGLLLATWEGQPDPTLWASGRWVPGQGMQEVEGLEAKLVLAADFGARGFFVPETQAEALRAWAKQQGLPLEVGTLHSQTTDPRDALAEYLERHEMPIGPAPRLKPKRAEHFLRIRDEQIATKFYGQYVLPDVVEQLRQRMPPELTQGTKKLVTIVSKGFDLIRLAVRLIRPAHCLLLHDSQLAQAAARQKAMIEQEAPDCRAETRLFEPGTRDQLLAAFRHAVHQLADRDRPQQLVFDLTAGKRIMNLALYDSVPPGSYVICLQADFDPNFRRPIPFTEQIDAWRMPAPRTP